MIVKLKAKVQKPKLHINRILPSTLFDFSIFFMLYFFALKRYALLTKLFFTTITSVSFVSFKQSPMAMRAVQVLNKGGPENLYIGTVARPEPKDGEVLIKVMATAINRADTLQRQGRYPVPPGVTDILGLEASGTVFLKGPNCSDKWTIGDRVMALLNGGGNAEYVTCLESQLMKIPLNMDFEQAAAIPEVWITAFQLLHTIGNIGVGDYVLIHGGASGVGTAAIQLCLQAGALPLVTAGSASKVNATLSLGAFAAFNYKQDDLVKEIMKVTQGTGVNLVLDCVGGSMVETNVNVLALDGKWIVYGLMGGGNVSGDLLQKVLSKRLTITGTTLRSRSPQYKKELVSNFSQHALPLFESGTFRPIIHTTLPLDQIKEAHQMMESNINTGKIVLTVGVESSPSKEDL